MKTVAQRLAARKANRALARKAARKLASAERRRQRVPKASRSVEDRRRFPGWSAKDAVEAPAKPLAPTTTPLRTSRSRVW
jgi:hypothetical protein